jgi:hypothetical protein
MYDRPSLNGRIQTFRSSSISRPMDRCAAGCGTDGVTLWVKGAYTACTAQLRPAGPHMHHRRTAVTTVAVPVLVHASSTVLCYARETVEIRLAMKANDWGLHCSDGHRCAPINISIHRPAASSVPPADPSVRPSPLLPIFLSVYCSVDDLQCRVAGLGSSFIISCKSSSSSPSVQHLFPFFG